MPGVVVLCGGGGSGGIIMAFTGKYLFVLLRAQYSIVYSDHSCAHHKISNSGLVNSKRLRWEVVVVIVLLYTLSHSAISVLKIMSPSNEVRLFLLFITSCHSRERLAVYASKIFLKGLFK